MKLIIAIIFSLLLGTTAIAEDRWVSITLERAPTLDRRGNRVDRPVFYARDRKRITTGGELLMLVDVPSHTILHGTVKSVAQAENIKRDAFKVKPVEPVKPESGVTK